VSVPSKHSLGLSAALRVAGRSLALLLSWSDLDAIGHVHAGRDADLPSGEFPFFFPSQTWALFCCRTHHLLFKRFQRKAFTCAQLRRASPSGPRVARRVRPASSSSDLLDEWGSSDTEGMDPCPSEPSFSPCDQQPLSSSSICRRTRSRSLSSISVWAVVPPDDPDQPLENSLIFEYNSVLDSPKQAADRERRPSIIPPNVMPRSSSLAFYKEMIDDCASSLYESEPPSPYGELQSPSASSSTCASSWYGSEFSSCAPSPTSATRPLTSEGRPARLKRRLSFFFGPPSASSHSNYRHSTSSIPVFTDLVPPRTRHSISPSISHTWRSTLRNGAYDVLLPRHGPSEMRRQEVIRELCETEQSFVFGLRSIVSLFARPLRIGDDAWMPIVPYSLSSLFERLEAIVRVHGRIADTLREAQRAQYPIIGCIADVFLPFVPQLDVHRAYLINLEKTTREVERLATSEGELGTFLRAQQRAPECARLSLSSLLLRPVQRLMKYPLFFKVRVVSNHTHRFFS
jgi:hypothetical protein